MKYEIDKATFDGLSEDAKKEYKLEGDKAVLVIEGGPDFAKLEQKLSIEKEHRKTAETNLQTAEAREDKLKKDLKNAGGDADKIAKIEEAHKKQIETLRAEREADVAKFKNERDAGLVNEVAQGFANKRFTIPSLVTPQIAARLKVEEVDGQPVVRVVGADGSPSTASLDDLKKEFLDNSELKSIIKADVGSGSGASQQTSGVGNASTKEFSKMNLTEQVKFKKENPEAYAAAVGGTE